MTPKTSTTNDNFDLIREKKTLPTNDFELTVIDLYIHIIQPGEFLKYIDWFLDQRRHMECGVPQHPHYLPQYLLLNLLFSLIQFN